MLNRREITTILISSLILGFIISLVETWQIFLYSLLLIFLVILVNVFAKKVAGFYLESDIEIGLWEIRRMGLFHFFNVSPKKTHPSQELKRPFPAGLFFPIVLKVITLGFFNWLACLTFEVKPRIYRAAKKHGLYKYSEMTEWHIGLIAAAGVFANLVFAIIGYFVGYGDFARLSIYFAFFSIIPLSDLDGNKIFFGSIILWSFLSALVLIGLGYAFFLI